jgi:hypothetical protein
MKICKAKTPIQLSTSSNREMARIGTSELQNAFSADALGSLSSVKFKEMMCEATSSYIGKKCNESIGMRMGL